MWKVMAADDEAYMQQALEKLIPWERLGCTPVSYTHLDVYKRQMELTYSVGVIPEIFLNCLEK